MFRKIRLDLLHTLHVNMVQMPQKFTVEQKEQRFLEDGKKSLREASDGNEYEKEINDSSYPFSSPISSPKNIFMKESELMNLLDPAFPAISKPSSVSTSSTDSLFVIFADHYLSVNVDSISATSSASISKNS